MTDPFPVRLEASYRVRFDEAGPDGCVRSAALLGYLQDVAWRHSEVLGFTRPWYRERGLAWLVRAIELEISGRIADGDEIVISTEIAGYRRVMARRRSGIRTGDGRALGCALVDWAMTDGRTVVRVPDEFTELPGIERGSFAPLRVAQPEPPADATALLLVPRLRELDPMGHANNGVYADWLDEAVAAADGSGLAASAGRRYRIEYIRPAIRGASLRSIAWPDGEAFWWRLRDAASAEDLARGRLERA